MGGKQYGIYQFFIGCLSTIPTKVQIWITFADFVILVTFHYFTESHTEICSELYHNKYNIIYYIIMEILPRYKDV